MRLRRSSRWRRRRTAAGWQPEECSQRVADGEVPHAQTGLARDCLPPNPSPLAMEGVEESDIGRRRARVRYDAAHGSIMDPLCQGGLKPGWFAGKALRQGFAFR